MSLENVNPISILKYGSSNIGSIVNMFKRLNIACKVVDYPSDIFLSNKVILPGVGSFDNGVNELRSTGFFEALQEFAQNENNFLLGICLGMQLLGNYSEEGQRDGLGLIKGGCKKFSPPPTSNLKVPHMGWNYISIKSHDSSLLQNIPAPYKFYFVHSYYFLPDNLDHRLSTTSYCLDFSSAIGTSNIFGVQFHPEKSHKYGLQLLTNFAKIEK